MSYAKPMVTIELDEYKELKKIKSDFEKGIHESKEDSKPYRKAISAIVGTLVKEANGNRQVFNMIIESPLKEGVIMNIGQIGNMGNYEVHCEMNPNLSENKKS